VKVVEDEVVWRQQFGPAVNAALIEGCISR
jgi:hypothetical protein